MLGRTYYHEILRKTIIAFGSLFNDIHIVRTDASGTTDLVLYDSTSTIDFDEALSVGTIPSYESVLIDTFGGDWIQFYDNCNLYYEDCPNCTFTDNNDGIGLSDLTNYCYRIQAVNFDTELPDSLYDIWQS